MSFLRAMCEWRDHGVIPGPLNLPIATRVIVTLGGKPRRGSFKGASSDGQYEVRLDDELDSRSFEKVEADL